MVNKTINNIVQVSADQSIQWFVIDAQGLVLSQQKFTDFSALPQALINEPCLLLLPGQEVFLDKISLPNTSQHNVTKALPFLLEEKLLQSADKLHIVSHKIKNTQQYVVAAIDKARFSAYFSEIQQQGLKPSLILPDYLALPYMESRWSVKISGEYAAVRYAPYAGFSVAVSHLVLSLQLKAKEQGSTTPIVIQDFSEEAPDAWGSDLGNNFIIEPMENKRAFDPHLLDKKAAVNFLQGHYQIKSGKKPRWAPVGYALLAWLLIIFLSAGTKALLYQGENKKLTQQITTLIKPLFPVGTNLSQPRELLQKTIVSLSQQQRQDDFIILLSQVGMVLQKFPAIELQSVSYDQQQLTLVIKAKQLALIENFSRALDQKKIKVKENKINTGKDDMTSQLVVIKS